jgi:hypothetical protein
MFWGVELVEDKATKKPFDASHNLTAKIVKAGLEVRSPCSALCRAALCCAVPCCAVLCRAALCCAVLMQLLSPTFCLGCCLSLSFDPVSAS